MYSLALSLPLSLSGVVSECTWFGFRGKPQEWAVAHTEWAAGLGALCCLCGTQQRETQCQANTAGSQSSAQTHSPAVTAHSGALTDIQNLDLHLIKYLQLQVSKS